MPVALPPAMLDEQGRPLWRRLTSVNTAWTVPVLLGTVALLYLLPFVRRGWIPHDDGQLGLNAVRLLGGELPHVDFYDYAGGMTWFYALLFTLSGVDLVWIRYALLVAALVTVCAWYGIARRFDGPWQAAGVALVALSWSFPNYFAGLPSWWNVAFTSVAVLLIIRYAEQGSVLQLFMAGLCLGAGCCFKQSGAYLAGAALLSVLYIEQTRAPGPRRKGPWGGLLWVRVLVAAAAVAGLFYVMHGLWSTPIVVLLVVPVILTCVFLVLDAWCRDGALTNERMRRLVTACAALAAGVSIPVGLLVSPYVVEHRVSDLIRGVFILPQAFKVSAYYRWPPLGLSIVLIPVVVLVAFSGRVEDRLARALRRAAWALPVIVGAALWFEVGYLVTWNAFRSGEAVVVVAGVAWLWKERERVDERSRALFVLATVTAFFALYQYPFAAPVYFCYVAPFAVLTLYAYLSCGSAGVRFLRLPLLVTVALFAFLAVNPGYVENMGYRRVVSTLDTELGLPKASLTVSRSDALVYRRVVALVAAHGTPVIHAFPECPEIYFLSGTANPTSSPSSWPLSEENRRALWASQDIGLVVINHKPTFSGELGKPLLNEARRSFPHGETVGDFEVRWR